MLRPAMLRPARLVSSLARPASSAAAAAVSPRRSALYIPGSNLRALEKAKTLAADVLLLDLEDAVAPENKGLARRQVAEAVRSGEYGRTGGMRVRRRACASSSGSSRSRCSMAPKKRLTHSVGATKSKLASVARASCRCAQPPLSLCIPPSGGLKTVFMPRQRARCHFE